MKYFSLCGLSVFLLLVLLIAPSAFAEPSKTLTPTLEKVQGCWISYDNLDAYQSETIQIYKTGKFLRIHALDCEKINGHSEEEGHDIPFYSTGEVRIEGDKLIFHTKVEVIEEGSSCESEGSNPRVPLFFSPGELRVEQVKKTHSVTLRKVKPKSDLLELAFSEDETYYPQERCERAVEFGCKPNPSFKEGDDIKKTPVLICVP